MGGSGGEWAWMVSRKGEREKEDKNKEREQDAESKIEYRRKEMQ